MRLNKNIPKEASQWFRGHFQHIMTATWSSFHGLSEKYDVRTVFFVKQVFFGLASKLPHAVAFCQAEASVDDKEQLAMPGSQVRQIPFESELEIDHSWNWKWTEFFLVVFQAFLNSDWWIIPVGSTLITRGSQIYGCATHKLTAASTLGRRLRTASAKISTIQTSTTLLCDLAWPSESRIEKYGLITGNRKCPMSWAYLHPMSVWNHQPSHIYPRSSNKQRLKD